MSELSSSAAEAPSNTMQAASSPLVDPETTRPAAPEIDPEPEEGPISEPRPEVDPDEPEQEPDQKPDPEPLPEAIATYQAEPSTATVAEAETIIGNTSVVPAPDVEASSRAAPSSGQAFTTANGQKPPADAEPEESFADIFSEFNRTSSRRDTGGQGSSQIRGNVVSVTVDSVLVDIGYKSEGILPLTAFSTNRETGEASVKAGDTLQVSVKGRDMDGYYELSLFKTAQPKDWSSLEKAFEEKSTIVGTVTAVVKGGLHVDVGIRAFLPASRSGARDAAEMEKLIGQEIRIRVTKLNIADEDLVVDRRVVTEEEALASKDRRFAQVMEGAVIDGTVRSLTEYGAFIDLGGVDGLLHISDIAWSRVANVADVLTVGQQLEVKILKIDPETRRIALGLKQLQPHPWDSLESRYHLGDRIKGVVTRIADFGAFVELEPGVEGLVHLSEMSYTKRILKATEVVRVEDVVDVVILAIAIPERRISLGLKQALGDPWVEAAARLVPGTIVEGPVASITKFGAFIAVSEGVQGLVHISEIVPDRRLNHPSDVLHNGQIVRALVLEVDKDKRQLKLSIKQLIPTGLDEFLAEHRAGDAVTGRVVSIHDGRAQVELGEGILFPCLLPVTQVSVADEAPATLSASEKVDLSAFSSMLKSKWKNGSGSPSTTPGNASSKASPAAVVAAGQVRSFRITKLELEAKHIEIELA